MSLLPFSLGNCHRLWKLTGDFNSNKVWDKVDRWWSHSDVIEELELMGITSLYHAQTNEDQGDEKTPTFFHQRKLNKPFHIDYVFTGGGLSKSSLEIGRADEWLEYSDHMPLSVMLRSEENE